MSFWKSLPIGRVKTKIWKVFQGKMSSYGVIYRHNCMPEQRPEFTELRDGPFQFYVPMITLYIFFHHLTILLMLHLQRSVNRISFNPLSECDYVHCSRIFLCLSEFWVFLPFSSKNSLWWSLSFFLSSSSFFFLFNLSTPHQ